MDDSDDYFPDDLVLDDQTLALLDKEEQKYLSQANSLSPHPLATKRLKTETGWKPGIGSGSTQSEDLPEISIQVDGSYAVGGHQAVSLRIRNQSTPPFPPRSITHNQQSFPPTTDNHYVQPRNRHYNHDTRPNNNNSRPNSRNTMKHLPTSGMNIDNRHPSATQIKEFQLKLEELRKENLEMQNALKEATEVKLKREGEISILRKHIEKDSREHQLQIAKFQAAKDNADAKQVRIQKDMQEEIERLKTQFIFKQQELESTIRKPPPSVRGHKKPWKEVPSTPIMNSSQMSGWNHSTTSAQPGGIPLRSPVIQSIKHKDPPKTHVHRSPGKPKTSAMLPGFQNAFIDTPRVLPSSQVLTKKGKERLIESNVSDHDPNSMIVQQHPISQPSLPNIPGSSPMPRSSPQKMNLDSDDIIMEDVDELEIEDFDTVKHIDPKAELSRILLTHSLAQNEHPTVHLLPKIYDEPSLDPSIAANHSAACLTIFEAIANSVKSPDYEGLQNDISGALIVVISCFAVTKHFMVLASLLDLLTTLSYSLPKFSISLLADRAGDTGNGTHLMNVICNAIREHFAPPKQFQDNDLLIDKTLLFLESLCFNVSDVSLKQIAIIASKRESILTLLHESQPSWVLLRTCRLLVLLATHRHLHRILLRPSRSDVEKENAKDIATLPYIERMCSLLVDETRIGIEFQTIKVYILMFFALLSMWDSESHSILVTSHVVVPSLVLFLTQVTSPLWEDDELSMISVESASSIVRTLNHALFVLHYLVSGLEPALNLGQALHHAPRRPFNGLNHMFIVTLGRLSYADPPRWLEKQPRAELDLLTEISKELLDMVVDGPEGESVWAAFQADIDESTVIDEAEMEATLMGFGDEL